MNRHGIYEEKNVYKNRLADFHIHGNLRAFCLKKDTPIVLMKSEHRFIHFHRVS